MSGRGTQLMSNLTVVWSEVNRFVPIDRDEIERELHDLEVRSDMRRLARACFMPTGQDCNECGAYMSIVQEITEPNELPFCDVCEV